MQFPNVFPRFLIIFAALSCLGIGKVHAQKAMVSAPVSSQPDLFEASLGFNYIYLDQAFPETRHLYGLDASLFVNATSWLGVGGDFMANFGSHTVPTFFGGVDVDSRRFVYVFGPRITLWRDPRFKVFVEALAGGVHAEAEITSTRFSTRTASASADAFAAAVRAGFDLPL